MSPESKNSIWGRVLRRLHRPRNRWQWAGWTIFALSAFFALYMSVLYVIVTAKFEGKRWRFPSKVYSDSFILYPGQEIVGIQLLDRLNRLGYRAVDGSPDQQGLFHLENGRLDLFLNEFSYPDHEFKGGRVRLELSGDRIDRITDLDQNAELALAEIEPELITAFYDKDWEERNLVRLSEL